MSYNILLSLFSYRVSLFTRLGPLFWPGWMEEGAGRLAIGWTCCNCGGHENAGLLKFIEELCDRSIDNVTQSKWHLCCSSVVE